MKTIFLLFISLTLFCGHSTAQTPMAQNPIIPGFNPDPSICRVGEDYYLVTSSWEYSPSIPIYHSKDLVNWKIVNYVSTAKNPIDLTSYVSYGGVWAPSIRHNKGTFYVTVSVVKRTAEEGLTNIQNLLFETTDVLGDWSQAYTLSDDLTFGIDPSFFFDDDKCYLLLNRKPPSIEDKTTKVREICIYDVDLENHKIVGEPITLTTGFAKNATYAEGPHIYKKDGWYYLLISEGGTGFYHAITISRSKSVKGPYVQYEGNPILTHRHLSENYPIQNVGHADFIQTTNGEWWSVMLGIRLTEDGKHSIMGRETFLCPLTWEKDCWPILNTNQGVLPQQFVAPSLTEYKRKSANGKDEFKAEELALYWNFLRTPKSTFYRIGDGLEMDLSPEKITTVSSPSFIGRRITNSDFEVKTKIKFSTKKENEEAGIVLISSHYENYRFVISKNTVSLIANNKEDKVLATLPCKGKNNHYLKVVSDVEKFSFYYSNDNEEWKAVYKNALPDVLGFRHTTGDYIGMYGSSNGEKTNADVTFEWFSYQPL